MTSGPCLCGDPSTYCPRCFPDQAAKVYEWVENFFEGEGAVGFTFCQTCRHFTAWGGATSTSEPGQRCDVLALDKRDPTDCPAWEKAHPDEENGA